jgi:hypothetical protein
MEQLRQQLEVLGSEKVSYAVIFRKPNSAFTGLVHLAAHFLPPRNGGVSKWKELLPALVTAQFLSAGTKSDSDWKATLLSAPAEVVVEMGTLLTPARGSDAHYLALLEVKTWTEAKRLDPEACLKQRFQIKDVIGANESATAIGEPVTHLRAWQIKVHDELMQQNKRQILFVIDRRGGQGKSTLARYLMQQYRGTHLSLTNIDKSNDLNHILSKQKAGLQSVVFDFPRNCRPSRFPWDTIEGLKNGILGSGKYDGNMVFFPGSVKVAVFTNHHPGGEFDRLTEDRISLFDLDEEFDLHGEALSQLTPSPTTPRAEGDGDLSLDLGSGHSKFPEASVKHPACPSCHCGTDAPSLPSSPPSEANSFSQ